MKTNLITTKDYLLLIDEKAEIRVGDIAIHDFGMGYELEIPCDVDNLRSNTRHKVMAYYPLTKEAKELDLPLLPSPFEDKVDVEILAEEHLQKWRALNNIHLSNKIHADRCKNDFIAGYKAAQAKQLELLKRAIQLASDAENIEEVEEEIIQSLSAQKLLSKCISSYKMGCVKVTCDGECKECNYWRKY